MPVTKPLTQLAVVLLAWALWLDARFITMDEAPRERLVPDVTDAKYQSLEACETEIDRMLADSAVGRKWAWTVEGHYAIYEDDERTYILRFLCLPDEPPARTDVG